MSVETQVKPEPEANPAPEAKPEPQTKPSPGHSPVNGGHASRNGEALSAISRRVVGLLKEHSGKGPVKARAYYWNDLLVVLMTDGYTTVEHTLLQQGRTKTVMQQRAEFHEVMIPHFKLVIEQELGREVMACMNSSHYAPDMNAELFVLAPREDGVAVRNGSQPDASHNGASTNGQA
jgi:uncharacterized protein YbcI